MKIFDAIKKSKKNFRNSQKLPTSFIVFEKKFYPEINIHCKNQAQTMIQFPFNITANNELRMIIMIRIMNSRVLLRQTIKNLH